MFSVSSVCSKATQNAVGVLEEGERLSRQWIKHYEARKRLLQVVPKGVAPMWWSNTKCQELEKKKKKFDKSLKKLEGLRVESIHRYERLKNVARPLVVPAILKDFNAYQEIYGSFKEVEKDSILAIDK